MPLASDLPRQKQFTTDLLVWYRKEKRDLPWRRSTDPYAVWVSEMMLQQTQVATAIPYWQRWMAQFPTIGALALAPLDDVLKAWQGLGYYARARNLHKAAQVIVASHGGVFPTRFDEVLALPGIGRYTAGAVCSIALGLDVPIVDANVIRVLCRVFAISGDPKSSSVQEKLWERAESLLPSGEASEFNQGMMELGALVCGTKPRCEICPVQQICLAYESGRTQTLPEFAPRAVFTTQTDVSAIVAHPVESDRILLVQRPAGGLWGGLWETPRVTLHEGESPTQTAERAAREVAGLSVHIESSTPLAIVRHGVTTRKITLLAIDCAAETAEAHATGGELFAWVTLDEINYYALSSPQVRLLTQIQEKRTAPQTALLFDE